MNKKIYVKPLIEIEEVEAVEMICTSTEQVFGILENEGYTEEEW